MNKIILKIWYSCNHKCDFCHAEYNKQIKDNATLKTTKKILYVKKNKKDVDTIIFSWGEPTIQSNFFSLLELSSSLWFKTWIVTNGSMIYKDDFLEKCLKYNLSYVYLSIHWWTEELHNKMTQTLNSFYQIEKLLSNQKLKKVNVLINCVVTKNNIYNLEDVILFINNHWYNKIKFSLLEPKWLWLSDIDNLFVSLDIVSKEIIRLIDKYKEINIYWDWFPLCLVKWYEDKVSNLQTENIIYMSELFEEEIYNTDYGIREYWKKCKNCKLKNICYWNFNKYNEIYGDDYLINNT